MAQPRFKAPSLQELILAFQDTGSGDKLRAVQEGFRSGIKTGTSLADRVVQRQEQKAELKRRAAELKSKVGAAQKLKQPVLRQIGEVDPDLSLKTAAEIEKIAAKPGEQEKMVTPVQAKQEFGITIQRPMTETLFNKKFAQIQKAAEVQDVSTASQVSAIRARMAASQATIKRLQASLNPITGIDPATLVDPGTSQPSKTAKALHTQAVDAFTDQLLAQEKAAELSGQAMTIEDVAAQASTMADSLFPPEVFMNPNLADAQTNGMLAFIKSIKESVINRFSFKRTKDENTTFDPDSFLDKEEGK